MYVFNVKYNFQSLYSFLLNTIYFFRAQFGVFTCDRMVQLEKAPKSSELDCNN